MDSHPQARTSLPKAKSRSVGPCPPCERPVQDKRPTVHLYGQAFHHDCAFYRSLRKDARQARPARSR